MNPGVTGVGGLGVNQCEGVDFGAKKRLLGGEIQGMDVIHSLELV